MRDKMIIIQKNEIVLRELTEKDAFLLVNWLSNGAKK